MQCSQCGHDNPPTARFCAACGANQDLACPSCGAAIAAGQKFCTDCGTGLPPATHTSAGAELPRTPRVYTPPHLAEKILATRHAMHGERKQVTVLFCDVVDSTTMARELGAEAMHELLSDFFRVTLARVHRFEGTVNQFLGDGFMAIFGAPLALKDHATRAALTALAIRDAVAEHRTQNTISGWQRLHVRMGLNSGQVVVGAIGDDLRMETTPRAVTSPTLLHASKRKPALAKFSAASRRLKRRKIPWMRSRWAPLPLKAPKSRSHATDY